MIYIDPLLKEEFEKGTFCTLVRITTELGEVFGYTDYATELNYNGTEFQPAPDLIRLRNYQTTSTQSNNQKVKIVRLGDFSESDLQNGMFDNATVEVLRVVPSRLELGHYLISKENIAATKWDELSLNFDVLDIFRGLNTEIGTINAPTCRHEFGDQFSPSKAGACTLNANNFSYDVTVSSVVRSKMEFTISSSLPPGWLSNGDVTWTFGNNAGGRGTIKTHKEDAGVHYIILFIPSTFDIKVGDTLKVVVGCDGTFETCQEKFSNGRNFGGNPLMNPGVTLR